MLALQLEVSFCSFYFVGAELSDATTGESRETGEPAFVYGIEPCTDWWCTKSHMIVVDEGRNSSDGDTVGSMEGWYRLDRLAGRPDCLAVVPPLNCAWGCAVDVHHV